VTLQVKRVYADAAPSDGFRVLVDRLWPRGVSKERAVLGLWAKQVAPTTELRVWFHAHPAEFDEFADRYRAELAVNPEVDRLRAELAAHPVATLLYGTHDVEHNHARILAEVLAG
jgi:DNA-3-methyladenine glycosylase